VIRRANYGEKTTPARAASELAALRFAASDKDKACRNAIGDSCCLDGIVRLWCAGLGVRQGEVRRQLAGRPAAGEFFQAEADGAYAKYGLDVTIVPDGPQANGELLLIYGKLDF